VFFGREKGKILIFKGYKWRGDMRAELERNKKILDQRELEFRHEFEIS